VSEPAGEEHPIRYPLLIQKVSLCQSSPESNIFLTSASSKGKLIGAPFVMSQRASSI
jgi:hypothetical protein